MSATTFEGVVERGQIKLESGVSLPDGTRVYVVVPGIEIERKEVQFHSPRLARPEQIVDFDLEIVES